MRHLKGIVPAALMTLVLAGFLSLGHASATTLEVGGATKNESVTLTMSMKAGSSMVLRDTFGFFANTCNESHVAGKTEKNFSTTPTEVISELMFSSCDHTFTVHSPGKLYVEWTTGTNGRILSEESEITTFSTIHGTHINCKTGTGTPIGTLTGVAAGSATLDLNATINCGPHLSSARWTGTYTITSPDGLGVSP